MVQVPADILKRVQELMGEICAKDPKLACQLLSEIEELASISQTRNITPDDISTLTLVVKISNPDFHDD